MRFIRNYFWLGLILAFYTAGRLYFLARFPCDPLTPCFAMGVERLSLADGTPPVPGYVFFITAAGLINLAVHDPFKSLQWLQLILGFLAVIALYRTGKLVSSRRAGMGAALLFAANPLAWFYGETGAAEFNLAVFGVFCGYFFLRCLKDRRSLSLFRATLILGISGGFHPLWMALMLPAWVYLLFHFQEERAALGKQAATLLFVVLLWIIPAAVNSGGMGAFLYFAGAHYRGILARLSFDGGIMASRFAETRDLLFLLGVSAGLPAALSFLMGLRERFFPVRTGKRWLLSLWAVPAFLLILASPVFPADPALVLFMVPPLAAVTAVFADNFFDENSRGSLRMGVFLLLICLPGLFYLFLPAEKDAAPGRRSQDFPRHFVLRSIRTFDQQHSEILGSVRRQWRENEPAVMIFTEASPWKAVQARLCFPEAEVHLFEAGTRHEQYRFGQRFQVYDNRVDLQGRAAFLFAGPGSLPGGTPEPRLFSIRARPLFYFIPAGGAGTLEYLDGKFNLGR